LPGPARPGPAALGVENNAVQQLVPHPVLERAGPRPNRIIGLTAAVGRLHERQCRKAGMDGDLTDPAGKARLPAAPAPWRGRRGPCRRRSHPS
jgi:hypothetical protein